MCSSAVGSSSGTPSKLRCVDPSWMSRSGCECVWQGLHSWRWLRISQLFLIVAATDGIACEDTVQCVLQVVKRFGLKTRQEVFKEPRDRKRAQMVAKRLLGEAPILETYRSTKGAQQDAAKHEIVHLLRPKQQPNKAEPWMWKDSSWRELWVAIDGFSVEKRIRGEDPALRNKVFVEEHEELPVYTRDKHKTSSFATEKQGYIAITMAGYGVVAAVALHTATKQHGSRDPHAPTRFKFWTEQIVAQGLGDAATETMLRDKVWEVWHTPQPVAYSWFASHHLSPTCSQCTAVPFSS